MSIKIKDIPINERPRERLINGEVTNLSNEDLLAIILSSGTKNCSVKTLADVLLKEIGDLRLLSTINYNQLNKIKGIGKAKACILLACIELGKRINLEINSLNNIKFNNTKLIYKYYQERIGNKKQEYFYCVYLDNSLKIIKEKLLFKGTVNKSLVHPREIFKEAYLSSATAIICVHNHPSGNINPSQNDIQLTNRIIEISKILGIKFIDHLIIGMNSYYSFFENNKI